MCSLAFLLTYTVKYTESEYDIQNKRLLYKIHQTFVSLFVRTTLVSGPACSYGDSAANAKMLCPSKGNALSGM